MPYGSQKCDFNDLLKQGGIQAVQASLEKMVEIKSVDSLKIQEPRLDIVLQKIREDSIQKNINIQSQNVPTQKQRTSTQEMER